MNWPLIGLLGAVILLAGWFLERRASRGLPQSGESRAPHEHSLLDSPIPQPQAVLKKCPYCAEEVQYEAIKCRYCGEMLQEPVLAGTVAQQGSPVLRIAGALAFVLGTAAAVYYFAFFDTSVPTDRVTVLGQTIGGERVHNIGLMQDRQNGLILGTVASLIGLGLLLYAQKRSR